MSKELSESIKSMLSIEDVEKLLTELGAEPRVRNNTIQCKTICHNDPYCGSHKLYCYFNDNTFIFHCYTTCGDSFDIFELLLKINPTWSLPQSVNYIIDYFQLPIVITSVDNTISQELSQSFEILNKYIRNNEKAIEKTVELNEYDNKILRHLPKPRNKYWEDEGISMEVMNQTGIAYDPVGEGIIIPHYSTGGQLVGIRSRTLITELEAFGKYRPAILNNQMYNHPLGFNLYNLNNSKDNIKLFEKAIVFEGEKACLQYQSMYGKESDISAAVCGSNINAYQVQLLIAAGAKEIIIAFDKQFKDIGDTEWLKWTNKLKDIHSKFCGYVQISYMFDKEDKLDYKDSPIDKGQETFEFLFKNRVMI